MTKYSTSFLAVIYWTGRDWWKGVLAEFSHTLGFAWLVFFDYRMFILLLTGHIFCNILQVVIEPQRLPKELKNAGKKLNCYRLTTAPTVLIKTHTYTHNILKTIFHTNVSYT